MLSVLLEFQNPFQLPKANDENDCRRFLKLLFVPVHDSPDIFFLSNNHITRSIFNEIDSPKLLPFPLALASFEKILHTLAWADTNIKMQIEDVLIPLKLNNNHIKTIVNYACEIFCILLKQEDYYLISRINFNRSIYLQNKIVTIVY